MIIHLKKNIDRKKANEVSSGLSGILIEKNGHFIVITSSNLKEVPTPFSSFVDELFVFENDAQLSSNNYISEKREIKINEITIGGKHRNSLVITGPCAVESEDQIEKSANLLKELGLSTLRGGCFKPRTSPYSFQGLGLEGLKLLGKIRSKYGLNIITEVRDATHIEEVIEYADIIQVGSRAMYNTGILERCGKTNKPVLLKRGFGATLAEFIQAAEYILSGGNENVILCERGIRTFETQTRFTLDLCGVAYLKEHTNLPIIIDPSHAIGFSYGVPDLARAAMVMDVDGLLIESHPDPVKARSDIPQQLNHQEFRNLLKSLRLFAEVMDKKII